MKISTRSARLMAVVLLLASLYTLALGVRRYILVASYGGTSVGVVPFTLESALQYRRIKMIIDRGSLPVHDEMIQRPEGIDPASTYTVFVDYLQARLCRALPGADLTAKLRWIESGWFCLAIPILTLWGRKATGRWVPGIVAGFFYAVSIASVQRTTGAELSTENTAFPFLAAHFLCRAASRESSEKGRIGWRIGSAASLAMAVVSWDLMQFYLFMWAAVGAWRTLRSDWKYSGDESRLWRTEWVALVLVSALNTYHRAHGLFTSPALLVASASVMLSSFRHQRLIRRRMPLPPVMIFVLGSIFIIAGNGNFVGSYAHFADLLWAKIRFHNIKPADPLMLTFDQRLMWTPALHSPTFMLTVQILAVMFAINLPAVLAVGRSSLKNLDFQQPLIGFVFSSVVYVFFFRFHVFVAFFGAMLAAVWCALIRRGEVANPSRAFGWICFCLFIETIHTLRGPWNAGLGGYPGLWGMREGIYYDEQVELTNWLSKHVKPDTVLAGFGISGPIAAYGKCGVILHPKFETRAAREKVKEYAEELFTGTVKSFHDWADRQGASYFVYGMGSFSTNEPTLQLRYMAGAMNPPADCPARFFEAGREDGHYFMHVFSNRKYHVYKMLTTAEEVAANVAVRRASEAFETGDLDAAKVQAERAIGSNPNSGEAQKILQHVYSLKNKGFSSGHESGR